MAATATSVPVSALPAERFFRVSLSLLVFTAMVSLGSTGKLDPVIGRGKRVGPARQGGCRDQAGKLQQFAAGASMAECGRISEHGTDCSSIDRRLRLE